jgi:hypothetical protein
MSRHSEFYVEAPIADMNERANRQISLGESAIAIIRKLAPKRAFAGADLKANWATIVGEDIAAHAQYAGISFPGRARTGGTIFVTLASASYGAVMQYRFPAIIERANRFFGEGAIACVRIRASEPPARTKRPGSR